MIHSKVTMDMGSTLGALKLQVAVGGMEEDLSMSQLGRGRRAHGASTGLGPGPCCVEGTPYHKPALPP